MNELTGEVQQHPTGLRGLLSRVSRGIGSVTEPFSIPDNKVPLEKINPDTVAWVINNFVGNQVQEKFGNGRYANGMTLPDIMASGGYPTEGDYYEKFPTEYPAFRLATQRLVDLGVLAQKDQVEDSRNETLRYDVVNEQKLGELAALGREALKQKPVNTNQNLEPQSRRF